MTLIEPFERVADISDQATRIELSHVENLLAQNKKALDVVIPDNFDGCCTECGREIPKERLEAVKTTLCAPCKNAGEIRSRQYR